MSNADAVLSPPPVAVRPALRVGGSRVPARSPGHVDFLIDNADAYRAVVALVRGARRELWISQLALDIDCVAYDVPGDRDGDEDAVVTLADELRRAAERGVHVRIVLNASLLLNTVAPLRAWIATFSRVAGRFQVRGVSRFPQLLHTKMVVADQEAALLVGSPFTNGYWDDSRHLPLDPRRPQRELGGRPVHDVSVRLSGAVVDQLALVFAELWNNADDVADGEAEPVHVRAPAPDSSRGDDGHAPFGIFATSPRRSTPQRGDGRMEILPALLAGIRDARERIYVEHQYLSSRRVVAELAAALVREPQLELVVVLNQNPDVTAYRVWQNTRLTEAGLLDHPRVGIFSLWSSARATTTEAPLLTQLFVHSKVVVIDDRWVMAGSANLDGVSLHSYGSDFKSALGGWVFRDVRNFDVNVLVNAGASTGDDQPGSGVARALRCALWHEHLGRHDHDDRAWVARWRERAQENILALRAGEISRQPRVIALPYVTPATPRAQLAELGVDLRTHGIRLCFEPSWSEVHLSPNWFRNMFA